MPQREEATAGLRGLPPAQDITAPPVLIAPELPAMEKRGEVRTVLRNTLLPIMGGGADQTAAGRGTMAPIPAQAPGPVAPEGKPQQPPEGQPVSSAGYVRMTVRLENGQLSVTDVKQVPGPLAVPSSVIRGYAYEVLLEDQQVALGSVPDVGVQRSFANRDVEGREGKHHFARLHTIEFPVRIPKSYVSTVNLPKLHIVLHNVREAPDRFVSLAPLQKQAGVNTVEVSRLSGIRLEQLSPALRPHLEEILREIDRTE